MLLRASQWQYQRWPEATGAQNLRVHVAGLDLALTLAWALTRALIDQLVGPQLFLYGLTLGPQAHGVARPPI